MKIPHARIADLWCGLMHAEPMWPSHGQYECRTCGRRYPVCWQEPPAATVRALVLPGEKLAPAYLLAATEPGIPSL
jgi:hypothetical protein